MKMKKNSSVGEQRGFTLVELLVSVALAGVVMATVYSSYVSQQKAYVTQEQVAMMQQNLRAALYHLERDIRMAGYDPTGKAGAGIVTANANSIRFTKDDGTQDGDLLDSNEDITYSLDGQRILRKNPGNQQVAENIDALNFVYLDANGAVTATLNDIRSVQISIVARTPRQDTGFTDPTVYTNFQGTTIYTPTGDNLKFRRNILRVEVKCRNIGMS
jgi:type IV pilus assembly protein PilW